MLKMEVIAFQVMPYVWNTDLLIIFFLAIKLIGPLGKATY